MHQISILKQTEVKSLNLDKQSKTGRAGMRLEFHYLCIV